MEEIIQNLIQPAETKIVMLVMDGVGGISNPDKTELQAADKPNLDQLAAESETGLLTPIYPGITPGSGPGHFGLFGYDPIKYNIGRGVLSALGINFPLQAGDLAARINFCTVNAEGNVTDRRAGRISNEECERVCNKINDAIQAPPGMEIFFQPVKEHRALLVLRGDKLCEKIRETDPQKTGVPPLKPDALTDAARSTSEILEQVVSQVKNILKDEPQANMLLLRGFAEFRKFPGFENRYGLKALALASYPMYKGISRLLGMEVLDGLNSLEDEFEALKQYYEQYDFFFIHVKYTDSSGEDGDFDRKVKMIEKADSFVPQVKTLNPDVFVVSADHSTPSQMAQHSWHPVPVMMKSPYARIDTVRKFDEISCCQGAIGNMLSYQFFTYLLANAGRLKKFGA